MKHLIKYWWAYLCAVVTLFVTWLLRRDTVVIEYQSWNDLLEEHKDEIELKQGELKNEYAKIRSELDDHFDLD